MKIIWFDDYGLQDIPGGTQQTNHIIIKYGHQLGFDIVEYRPHQIEELKDENGLFILNGITRLRPKNLNWILENKPYIRYEHDYWAKTHIARHPKLFENAILNIFLSPLHYEEHKHLTDNYVLQPSPVENFRLLPNIARRDNVCLSVGRADFHKGTHLVVEYAKERPYLKFEFYGWYPNDIVRKNIDVLPNCRRYHAVPNQLMPQIYASARYFIHLPTCKEAFGRTVLEAKLSGCQLILNQNIGATSYDWDWDNYEEIQRRNEGSPALFWDRIERILDDKTNW